MAAAFILTIDGIKATNIGDIIFNASGNDLGKNSNEQLTDGQEKIEGSMSFRPESLKGMVSDLTASNYTVAILGAALIAHELSQSEAG